MTKIEMEIDMHHMAQRIVGLLAEKAARDAELTRLRVERAELVEALEMVATTCGQNHMNCPTAPKTVAHVRALLARIGGK